MAVKLKKMQRRNPLDPTNPKWYLSQASAGSTSLKEIAKEIERRSSLSLGDVQSVLSNLMEVMPLFLKLGQTIKLDGFGTFRITVSSEGAVNPEDLNAHHVKGPKLIFQPGTELKRSLEGMSFEIA